MTDMTKPYDGGQAFPTTWPDQSPGYGMTLRDWFAGQAQGLPGEVDLYKFECLVGRLYRAEFGSLEHWRFVADAEAAWKFMQADAMIAAGEK